VPGTQDADGDARAGIEGRGRSDVMTRVGLDAARAYLRKPFRLTVEDGLPEYPLEEATSKLPSRD
jgi:hypothetical protein